MVVPRYGGPLPLTTPPFRNNVVAPRPVDAQSVFGFCLSIDHHDSPPLRAR